MLSEDFHDFHCIVLDRDVVQRDSVPRFIQTEVSICASLQQHVQ